MIKVIAIIYSIWASLRVRQVIKETKQVLKNPYDSYLVTKF